MKGRHLSETYDLVNFQCWPGRRCTMSLVCSRRPLQPSQPLHQPLAQPLPWYPESTMIRLTSASALGTFTSTLSSVMKNANNNRRDPLSVDTEKELRDDLDPADQRIPSCLVPRLPILPKRIL